MGSWNQMARSMLCCLLMLAAVVTIAVDRGETDTTPGADDARELLGSVNTWGGGGAVPNSAPDSTLQLEPANKDSNAKSEVLGAKSEVLGEVLGARSSRRRRLGFLPKGLLRALGSRRSRRRSGSRRRRSGSRRRRSGSRRRRSGPTKIVFSEEEAKVLSAETQNVMRGRGCVDHPECHHRGWLKRTKGLYKKYTEAHIKKNVGNRRNRKPNYGMTQIFRSSKGFCAVKYGYASVVLAPFKIVHLLVYSKVACSDDNVKFVTRRAYVRGWIMTSSKGKKETFGCFAHNKEKHCKKIVKLKWKPLTSQHLAKDPASFSVQ